MKLKDGIGMFDISKGIIMISVILYHTLCFMPVGRERIPQLAGLMLAMFFVYGYSMSPLPLKESIITRFKLLILPYIVFSLAHIVIRFAISLPRMISGELSLYGWFHYNALSMILAFNAENNPAFLGNGSLWFILALAISAVILNEILKLPGWKLQLAAVAGIVLMGYYAGNMARIRFGVAFNVFVAMMMTGYMYAGYWFKKKQLFYCSWPAAVYIGAGISSIIVIFFDRSIVAGFIWKYGLVSYVMLGVFSLLFLKIIMPLNLADNKYLDKIADIGYYSMAVYFAHSFELENISWVRMTELFGISFPISMLVQMICRIAFIFLSVYLYNEGSKRLKRLRRKNKMSKK